MATMQMMCESQECKHSQTSYLRINLTKLLDVVKTLKVKLLILSAKLEFNALLLMEKP